MSCTFLYRKPYRFVPFADSPPSRQIAVGHHVLRRDLYTGKMHLRIEALAPVHVGAGDGAIVAGLSGNPVKAFFRIGDKLVIPGSSLRGVVRSIAEAITHSCGPAVPDAKRQSSGDRRGHQRTLEEALPPNLRTKCLAQGNDRADSLLLCPTCRLFGTVNRNRHYRGQVRFGDFVMTTGQRVDQLIPRLQSPFRNYPTNDGERFIGGNERLYYCRLYQMQPRTTCTPELCEVCAKEEYFNQLDRISADEARTRPVRFRGRKFYCHGRTVRPSVDLQGNRVGVWVECAAPGSTFEGDLWFENLTRDDLQVLAFSLGLGGVLQLKLGYGKPVFLGSVQIELVTVNLRTGQLPQPAIKWFVDLGRSFTSRQADAVRTILCWDNAWDGLEPPNAPPNPPKVENRYIY